MVDEATRRAAEDAVFAALFRADLGFVARRLNKPISVRFTRHVLVRSPITPNQITLFAAALGVLGCALMATATTSGSCSGCLLEHTQSVLDGCDGELARVRFQQSKLGAWLDTFVDDVLNVLMTASAGDRALARRRGRLGAGVGLAGAAMLVLSNLDHHARHAPPEGHRRSHGHGLVVLGRPEAGRVDRDPGQARASARSCSRSAGATRRSSCGWSSRSLNQFVLVLIMAAIIALAWFVASVVQLIVRPAPAGR